MGAVFLSYASQDSDAAKRICDALRAAGIEVWFDQSELRGGDAWDRQIREQIHDCRLFVLVISANTEARDEGYFRREWALAVDRTRDMDEKKAFLLPVVIDDTVERSARVPEKLHGIQWMRLPGGVTPPAFVARVAALLGAPAPVATTAGPSPTSVTSPPAGTRNRRVVWIRFGLVALAITVGSYRFALRHPGLPRHADAGMASQSQPAVTEKSIAVLPFADMSEKKDQEYFADGMAEEILGLLAKIPELTVIGRTSSFQFKSKSEDLRTIGARLGAAFVVEGSVRKAGPRIRVTAQLIDARSGAHRWSESYDRDFGDILALQDEIATGIARALQLSIDTGESASQRHLVNAESYDLYLRGLLAQDQQSPEKLFEAVRNFEQALALNPTFLRAAEALARAHVDQGFDEALLSRDAWRDAREAAKRSLRIDSKSATAHAVVGLVHGEDEFDWNAAETEFNQALALNPSDPAALSYAAIIAGARGLTLVSQRLFNASLAIDPLNPYTHQHFGQMLFATGDFAGAQVTLQKSIAINATFDGNHYFLSRVLLARGDFEAALKEVQHEVAPDAQAAGLAMIYHGLHRKKDSDAALARLVAMAGETWPYSVATVYAFRGERDEAFDWLEKGLATRDSDQLEGIRGDPEFAALREDARYKALLHKMNLTE
jgi:TolB-like protein/Tfp pilus assembly protein PilF